MLRWLVSVAQGFRHAFRGWRDALCSQRNVRIHLAATLLVTALGLAQNLPAWKWCALVLAMGLVWTAELFNTALEILCDRITLEKDDAIRRIKDMAAGAVLAAALAALLIALLVFL